MATEEKRSRSLSELEKFDELFPVLVDDLTKHGMKDDEIAGAMKWFKRVSSKTAMFANLPTSQRQK